MRLESAVSSILKVETSLKIRGVEHVYLFGSVARNQATDQSDVDVVLEVKKSPSFDAFDLGGVLMDLEDALGANVDLVLRRAMSAEFARRVAVDLVRVF